MTDKGNSKGPHVKIVRTGASVVPGSERTQRTTRPVGRINDVLGEIKEIWRQNPDMRLTQLIWNVRPLINEPIKPANYDQMIASKFYNMEEQQLLEALRERYGCVHYNPEYLGMSKDGQTYRCRHCQEITYG